MVTYSNINRNLDLDGGSEIDVKDITKKIQAINRRLADFSLDPDGKLADQLMRENNWSPTFTQRVFKEYLRFMTLAATMPIEVTPSTIIDQVWHKHLEYRGSYHDVFCGSILKNEVAHKPGNGGDEERYRAQYLKTLEIYQAVFNEAAPSDVWPRKNNMIEDAVEAIKKGLRNLFTDNKKAAPSQRIRRSVKPSTSRATSEPAYSSSRDTSDSTTNDLLLLHILTNPGPSSYSEKHSDQHRPADHYFPERSDSGAVYDSHSTQDLQSHHSESGNTDFGGSSGGASCSSDGAASCGGGGCGGGGD